MEVIITTLEDAHAWDRYVNNHNAANVYQLYAWNGILSKTYGHRSYYLMALDCDNQQCGFSKSIDNDNHNKPPTYHTLRKAKVVGILPLFQLKSAIFGNNLFSIPFFDIGGILSDNVKAEKALLRESVRLGKNLNATSVELRQSQSLNSIPKPILESMENVDKSLTGKVSINDCKQRMVLKLPDNSEILMKSFKAKLRSQIKKPIKANLKAKVGGVELLDDFYRVFTINMRDLGSPVHSSKLIYQVLSNFPQTAKTIVVYRDAEPIAGSLIIGYKNILVNPWASALRKYRHLSSNMLLYWEMLAYGCDNGYHYFDFGRSTPDEGTYKFKQQWSATPWPLNWYTVNLGSAAHQTASPDKSLFNWAIQLWSKLPVPVSKIAGPIIRKHISL